MIRALTTPCLLLFALAAAICGALARDLGGALGFAAATGALLLLVVEERRNARLRAAVHKLVDDVKASETLGSMR